MRHSVKFLILVLLFFSAGHGEAARDKELGYYYLGIGKIENYSSSYNTSQDTSISEREDFAEGILFDLSSQQTPLQFSLFASGQDSKKLLIIATHDAFIDTEYRARALLWRLRLVGKRQDFFSNHESLRWARFLDLCKIMGFTQVVVSDGGTFSLTVNIK